MTTACAILCCGAVVAENPRATILGIDVENQAIYVGDVSDYSKLATNPNPAPPAPGTSRSLGVSAVRAVSRVTVKQIKQMSLKSCH